MSQPDLWQYLVQLKPSLPRHVRIQPRQYGKQTWYVLEDRASGNFHRFNELAYRLLGFMNGRNNLDQILGCASEAKLQQTLDDIPTREDVVELLQYLYVADLLICDFPPKTAEIFQRKQKKKQQFWHQLIKSPYAWKIPLLNPDRFLQTIKPYVSFMASPLMGAVWVAVVVYGISLALRNWSEISATRLTDILAPENLFLLWLTYPLLKVFHELGHGIFTTLWGGRVHEFGVVIILGTPFPYVDATAATGFNSKAQRLMVGAAGMAVELFFAAIALYLWLRVDPGIFRDILFNIVVIGSVSTIFFNGNPLMRFDGYHLLCDATDQPNLAARAALQIRHLARRYGYGTNDSWSPAETTGEAIGLTTYGAAAFIYRLSILVTVVLVVARHFPTLGLFFAGWLLLFQIILPLAKHLLYLFSSQELGSNRRRAISFSLICIVLFALLFFVVPFPYRTAAEGVLWLPEQARLRALTPGEVSESLLEDGQWVEAGEPVLHLSNIDITAQLLTKQATLAEYRSRYEQAWSLDRSQIQLFEQDIATIELEIEYLQQQVNNLVVKAPSSGRFRQVSHHQLKGSFIHEGDTIGLLVTDVAPRIRVALTQEEIAEVRNNTRSVEVQLAGEPGHFVRGSLYQEVPGGTFTLPSQALGTAGGGRIIVDGTREDGTRATERVFLVDVEVPRSATTALYGQRALVSFRHPPASIFARLQRAIHTLVVNLSSGH